MIIFQKDFNNDRYYYQPGESILINRYGVCWHNSANKFDLTINLSKTIPTNVTPIIRNSGSNAFNIVKDYGGADSAYLNLVPDTLLLYDERRTMVVRSTADNTLLWHGTFMCQLSCIIDLIQS